MADTQTRRRAYLIFEHSLELDATARAAYIAAECGDDAALLAEVRAFQTVDAAGSMDTGGLRGLGLEKPEALIGRQISHFRLLRYLGGGGMGLVFLGERTDNISQRVAIKIVRQELRGAASRTRFDLERATLARLENPSIARLIDAGVIEDGRPWYVMEYVDGSPIDEYCERAKLTLEARLQLLIEVCEAVDAAHRSLVVHRDIKPGNVLVTAEGRPKLIDFGIAKFLSSEAANNGLTRDTGALFTPHFAAPEQVTGSDVSTATDVFGLGALAFLLVTGKRIFESAGAKDFDYMLAVTQRDPQNASAVSGDRSLGGDIDNILCKAMARDPAERYASAADLAREFERYLRHEPVQAHAPSFGYTVSKFVRRNRVPVALGITLALASGAGMASYVSQSRAIAEQRDRASFEAARATRINQFLTSMLEFADPRLGDRGATIGSVLDEAAAQVDRSLGSDPAIAASVLTTIASADSSQTRYEQALQATDRAIALYRKSGAHPVDLATSISMRGYLLAQNGKQKESEAPLREGLAMLDRVAPGSTEQAAAQGRLAVVLGNMDRTKEAEPLFVQAIAQMRRSGVRDLSFVYVLNDYSVLLGTTGRPKEAVVLSREAVGLSEKLLGPDHAGTDDVRANLAGALSNVGSAEHNDALNEEAARVFSQIIDRRLRVLGPDQLDTLWSQANLANTLIELRRFSEALPLASKAGIALTKNFGATHPVTLYARSGEGRSRCDTGDYRNGITVLQDVAAKRLALYGPDHWLAANSQVLVGACQLRSGDARSAERTLLPAIAVLEKVRGPDFPKTQEAYGHLANSYQALGDAAKAASWRARIKISSG